MKRELSDFGELTEPEERLRDEIGLGELVSFGAEVPAEDAGPERSISGEFIRYLMLGGCDALPRPVPEAGVRVEGARITGVLDLQGARCPRNLALVGCRLDSAPVLLSARIDGLFLDGSVLPGLKSLTQYS